MASLKDIRNRIQSVKNTQKTTNAMQMVSAAKLKRSQDAIESAAPYASKLKKVVSILSNKFDEDSHPLLMKSDGNKTAIIIFSSDRGLCGGFNANLCKKIQTHINENGDELVEVICIGKKAAEYFQARGVKIDKVFKEFSPSNITNIINELIDDLSNKFIDKQIDRLLFAYNDFKNVLVQTPTINTLLPISSPEVTEVDEREIIFEPSPEVIFSEIIIKYVENQLLSSYLSSAAGEHASRMTAMDSATKNAGEMIKKLQLQYNRTRQAAITRELIEIISGAESI